MLVAVVVLLIVTLAGAAGGIWWLFIQNSAKQQAATDLTEAFAVSDSETGLTQWCDGFFGYGSDMVFEDQVGCLDAYAEWFEELSPSDRDRFAAVTVDSSTLATIDDETFVLRQSDLQRTNGDWNSFDEENARGLFFVIQDLPDQGGWRIVGVATQDISIGVVPSGAEDLIDEDPEADDSL